MLILGDTADELGRFNLKNSRAGPLFPYRAFGDFQVFKRANQSLGFLFNEQRAALERTIIQRAI
jgi:hypothetical protein